MNGCGAPPEMTHQFKLGDTGLTRYGDKYRVICTDVNEGKRGQTIVALVHLDGDPTETVREFWSNGRVDLGGQSNFDLLPPEKPKQTFREWFTAHGGGTFDEMLHILQIKDPYLHKAYADYLDEQARK